MKSVRWWALAALCAAASGCGSNGSTTGPTPATIQVAGSYNIHKVTVSDTCGGSQPGDAIDNPGEVRQPSATTFVLNDHGTRDLSGSLSSNGTFSIAPVQSVVQNTIPATDTFANGQFTVQGFQVRVTTDLQSNPITAGGAACRVVADWTGAKQGAPNIIP